MKFKKSHNLLLFVILIIFSLQLIGLAFLFFSPVKVASADVGVDPKVVGSVENSVTPGGVTFTPQVDIPGSRDFVKGSPIPFDENNRGLLIAQYIQAWYKFAVAAVGILAVVMIMAGGLIWLTAGGRANQISTAKDWIAGAIVGLILALMSYTLLDILNPSLVTFQSLKIDDVVFKDLSECPMGMSRFEIIHNDYNNFIAQAESSCSKTNSKVDYSKTWTKLNQSTETSMFFGCFACEISEYKGCTWLEVCNSSFPIECHPGICPLGGMSKCCCKEDMGEGLCIKK